MLLEPDIAHARRVCVVWLGRIGDVIVATPFLRALRRRLPGAEITLVLSHRCAQLAPLLPFADQITLIGPVHRPERHLMAAAGLLRRRFDLLVDLNSAPSRTSALVASVVRSKVKLAFRKGRWERAFTHLIPAAEEAEHMLDRYERLSRALGAGLERRFEVIVPPSAEAAAEKILPGRRDDKRLRVLIHPGNFKKFDHRWPEEKFAGLTAKLLADPGLQLFYLAGPGEGRRIAGILAKVPSPVPVLGPAPMGVVAELLRRFDLGIVNVTGTMHLAAAVGTPTFGLYSGYANAVWRPPGPDHGGCVSSSWISCRDITVDEAHAALRGALSQLRAAPKR